MLSIEKHPSDPSEISLLKSSSSDDRPCSDKKLDLSNSDLDDNNINNTSLPKFSIRDYVFGSRKKDIKTNWPFSQKNLQLCLKHGVTDLLPPFQSVKECAVINKDNNIVTSEEEHVKVVDDDPVFTNSSSAKCVPKLAADCRNINSSGSDRETCSEIDSKAERNSCLRVAAATSQEPPVEKLEAKGHLPPMSNKSGSTTLPAAKKCRLIVKLGNTTDNRHVEEDTTANNIMVSDSMASKVCPVCKTFSSSSNTTLNAHIDQCLSSGGSTIKWTANSKVTKHRIKPRKTRLMVDIYETAERCTLEDLDRRNGTNWSLNPSTAAVQETEAPPVEKLEKAPPAVSLERSGNEGAVYIDANGTKVRILSKFNDEQPSSSKPVNGGLQKKVVEGDKRCKFILTKKKKKKNHIQKHHKIMKSVPHAKKFGFSKPHQSPKVRIGQESYFSPKENVGEEDCPNKPLKSPDKLVSNGLGTIKQWVSSKRTGLTRKIGDKDDHQFLRGCVSACTRNDSVLLPPSNSSMKGNCFVKSPKSSARGVCLPETSHRVGDMLLGPRGEESGETSRQKKVDFSLSQSQFSSVKKRSLVLQRGKGKHLKVDHAHSMKSMKVGTNTDLSVITDKSEPSTSRPAFSLKASKFSPLRKNLLSANEGPAHGVKCNVKWKTTSRKRSSMGGNSESEEAGVDQTEGEKHRLRENLGETKLQGRKNCESLIFKRSRLLNFRKDGEGVMFSDTGSQSSAETPSDDDDGSNFTGPSDATRSVKENPQTETAETMDPAVTVGGEIMSFSKSLDAESDEFSGPASSHGGSRMFDEDYKGSFLGTNAATCSQDPILGVDGGIFRAAEIGESILDQNVNDVTEPESNDGQGNYFLEVDPIPIPGPPGSFLPSPGRMSSEDLHGSSSLTSNWIQSSVDHPEFVDQDDSGSPISGASTISNSTVAKAGSRCFEKSVGERDSSESFRCQTSLEDKRSKFSDSNVDLLVENSVSLLQTVNTGEDGDGLDKIKVKSSYPGKGNFRFTNDMPCCCVRKEGVAQGFSLNREESQLLQRRATAPSPLPVNENQTIHDSYRRPDNILLKTNSFSLSESSSGPETNKSSTGPTHFGVSADSDFKIPTRDSESFSPSASNPILRLMGKDLMVINKDEDSPLKRSSHSNSMNDLTNVRLPTFSCGSLPIEDIQSFHQVDANCRLASHSPQSGDPVQHFDVGLLNGFRGHDSYIRPQQSSPASPASFSSKNSGSGLMNSFGRREYLGGCNLHTMRYGPKKTCDVKKFITTPVSHWQNAASARNPVKEIIVIDDSPDDGADSANNVAYTAGTGKGKSSSAGVQMQITSGFTSSFVSFCESRPCDSPYSGSGVAQNANLPTHLNKIPAKWNGNPEGCGLVRPSSFSASSSPGGCGVRSSLYFSPGFS